MSAAAHLVSLLRALRPRRLHAQMALVGALLLVTVIAAHTVYTVKDGTGLAAAALESEARALAGNLADASAPALVMRHYSELEDLLVRTTDFPEVRRIQVGDRRGRVLADVLRDGDGRARRRFDAGSLSPPAENQPTMTRTGDNHLVVWEPIMAGTPVGWIRIEYSLRQVIALRASIVRNSAVVGLVSTALSVLLLVAFLRRPARAVQRATNFAARLHELRGQAFAPDRGIEEIEALGDALNRASLKLHEQERALAGTSRRLEAVLEHAIDGIITLDERGRIESANPAVERIFQYAAAELVGLPLTRLVPDLPLADDENADGDPLPPLETGGLRLELTAWRKDGLSFPIIVGLTEMQVDGRRLLVAVVRDISEQKRLDRMKTDFIGAVSHELRTPLTSIHGALGLLASGEVEGVEGKGRDLAVIAYKNSGRLTRLVNDILDFEKMQSGRMHFALRLVDLRTVVEQAVEAHRPQADQQHVELALDCAVTDARVLADADRLGQAISNLLANAIRLSSPGERVEIAMTPADARVRIAVTDHGPGIPEEYRPFLFQKFAQMDSADVRYKTGAGLGLSIARAIVDWFGGSLDYESTPYVRTTFFIELPRALAA